MLEHVDFLPATHLVAIGGSAGGQESLREFFQAMPDDTGCAFVIVQHLSPHFKSLTGEILRAKTAMPIESIYTRTKIVANKIYVLPPEYDLVATRSELVPTSRESGFRHDQSPIDGQERWRRCASARC
jgi:two-component system CheB/CheR fusion protein